jgi:hypothetical protein
VERTPSGWFPSIEEFGDIHTAVGRGDLEAHDPRIE